MQTFFARTPEKRERTRGLNAKIINVESGGKCEGKRTRKAKGGNFFSTKRGGFNFL
jgi:hypothetical protein